MVSPFPEKEKLMETVNDIGSHSGYGVVLSLNVLIWMNCVLVYFIYLIAIMYKFQMCDLLILRFGQLHIYKCDSVKLWICISFHLLFP